MDEAAADAPVAILKGMHVDKAEGCGCGLQHRVDAVAAHAFIRLQQPGHQIVEIPWARDDEFR